MSGKVFESWAYVELFGHSRLVGKVSEATIGGCSFLRLDVPEVKGNPAFTKYYGNGAVYAMTPLSEEAAQEYMNEISPNPHYVLGLPSPQHRDDEDDF